MWENCSGETDGYNTAELHITGTLSASDVRYRCRITDTGGDTVVSDAALLTVRPEATIITQP